MCIQNNDGNDITNLSSQRKLIVTYLRHYAKHVVGKYKINSFVIECILLNQL